MSGERLAEPRPEYLFFFRGNGVVMLFLNLSQSSPKQGGDFPLGPESMKARRNTKPFWADSQSYTISWAKLQANTALDFNSIDCRP